MGTKRALFVSLHPSNPGDAAGTHLEAIAAALAYEGWAVRIIRPRTAATSRSLIRRLFSWTAVQIRAAVAMRGSDVVYVRSHPAALFVSSFSRLVRRPVVQEVNGPHDDYLHAWPGLRRAPWAVSVPVEHQLERADAVVAVTDGLASWVSRITGRTDTCIVPNGVDVDTFHPAAERDARLPERYVVFVGALAAWQGLATLLTAAGDECWPQDVVLLVAGDGAERDLVLLHAQKQPDRVTWLGRVEHSAVPALLAHALAAAVTSTDRSGTGVSPLKLYEAMATGTPVIVPEVSGSAETVRQADCGVVVPVCTPSALAAAVASLAADPALRARLGANGRAAAVRGHSWIDRGQRTARVLDSVISTGRPSCG